MTGYGKEVIQLPSKTITIEIKSLNSKGLDLNTRIPSAYREKELEMRDILAKSMQRGKVDFSIYRSHWRGNNYPVKRSNRKAIYKAAIKCSQWRPCRATKNGRKNARCTKN